MIGTYLRFLAAGVICSVLAGGAASGGTALIRPAEGPEVEGRLSELAEGKIQVHTDAGPRDFKLADLMAVEFRDAKAPAAGDSARIYTPAGDVIPANVELGGGGKIRASGSCAAPFEVTAKDISGVLLPAGAADERVSGEMAQRGRRKDKLFLLGDELEGSFEGLTKDGVKFRSVLSGDQPDEYKLAQVRALAFAELESFSPPADTHYVAELAGGGRVVGRPVSLSGDRLSWKTLGGMDLDLSLPVISALRVVNGKVVFLSDLEPTGVEEKPFIQGLPFVWSWQRDRDVFCRPLALGGRKFTRGLGTAAFTRLSYRLDGRYRRFKAAVGVLDTAAAGGKTVFRALVDGKELFGNGETPLTRGAKPREIDVDVTGAKLLDLVMEFGPDGSDLGDIGGWGEARLIK